MKGTRPGPALLGIPGGKQKLPRDSSSQIGKTYQAFLLRRCDWKWKNRSLSADYSGSS